MVDPIDGTSDFILGDNGFAVMIGLVVDGRPKVGAVAHPLAGKTYTGIVGVGAWLDHRHTGSGRHCRRRRSPARPASGWWRRSRTARRASTPSSARS